MGKKSKLILNKNTVKNIKINSDIKAGATVSCGEASRIECQSRLALTQTCANCYSISTITVGPTIDC